MKALLLVGLAMAAPYQDVENRFSVDLPTGWDFAPMPGDTTGAYFRRINEGMLANATVRAFDFGAPVALAAFAARIAAASDQEPGFHLLVSENVQVVSLPAMRRRYVVSINGDPSLAKMVEQRIVVIGNKGFVLHAECMADVFGTFESDFNKFFAGFKPGSSERLVPIPLKAGAKSRKVDTRQLLGKWESNGHALHLSPGGVVVVDGLHGSYRIDGPVLVFSLGAEERIYEFSLHDGLLKLSGGAFGDGQTFRRPR